MHYIDSRGTTELPIAYRGSPDQCGYNWRLPETSVLFCCNEGDLWYNDAAMLLSKSKQVFAIEAEPDQAEPDPIQAVTDSSCVYSDQTVLNEANN